MFNDIKTTVSITAAIISVITLIINYYQTKKSWYINIIAKERLEWTEHLRSAVLDFIAAFYNHKDLRLYKDKVILYLNPANENHHQIIDDINDICSGELTNINKLVITTQKLLNWNWREAKSETGITYWQEKHRDKKADKWPEHRYIKSYTDKKNL